MAFIGNRRTCRGQNLSLTDMALKWTLLVLLIFVNISRTYAQEVCPERDVEAAGRRCERPCSADGTCRKQNRECVCDGKCGLSCLRRSAGEVCERNEEEISRLGRRCMRPCDSGDDCLGNRECVCDDICGMSCIPTAQEVCPERDVEAAGRRCERSCSADGTCRKQNRECVCDGMCGLSCLRRSAGELCERNEEEISRLGRRCMRPCDSSDDCLGIRECVCDDICGMSCIPTGREEYCPRLQERGANFTLTIEPSSRAFGSIATYSCRRNFERVRGDVEIKCLGVGEWSGTPSVCLNRYRCEPPPEIENAWPIVMKDYYDHEEQVAFSCSPGFARVGGIRAVLTCNRNTWTEPQFQCRRKSCGDPGFLLNGRKIGTSFLFRDTVRYECDVGYRLIGPEERVCQFNQEWTRVTPTCQVVRCPAVTHPNNGRRIGYGFEYDSELYFRCNTGYILEGNEEIRCQANGTWSRPVPTCRAKRCPAPSVPEHGSSDADRSEYSYGDTVTFSCASDYQLRGSSVVNCSSNEYWFPPPPICQATCRVPTPPHYGGWQNSAREGQRVVEGHELGYYCRRTHFKCQVFPLRCVNGSWTPPASNLCLRSCRTKTAQTVGLTISYSHPDGISCTHPDLKPVGTIRSFTCLTGYRIPFGVSHQSTCDRRYNNQRWSSSLPTCEKILCPRIYLSNGDVRYTLSGTFTSTLGQNTTASFLCHRGYDLSHPNSSSCDMGQWTNEKPDCIEQSCSESSIAVGNWDVGYDTRASVSSPGYRRPGTVASFNCIEYGYSTSIQHTCRRGQWEGQRPVCQRIPCRDQFLNNGMTIYTSDRIAHGTVRTYQCDQGFTLRGIESSYCDGGRWTNDLPECIEASSGCRRPHINPSVMVHVGADDIPIGSRQFFTEGEIITSRCDDPRSKLLIGPVRRRCTDEGWTETAPSCENSQLRMGVDNTRLFGFLPDGTFVVFPISGQVWITCKKLSGSDFSSSATISTNSSARGRLVQREARLRRLVIYDPTPASSGTYTCRDTNSLSRFINIRFQDIRCTEPDAVSNGRWEHRKSAANEFTPLSYIFKETVTLHCNDGYRVNGTRDSQCNYQGRWSPPLASCVAN